jgi:hypothetical protein
MLNEYKDGGLKMLDIQSFNWALKSKWVKMMTTTKQNGNSFLTFLLNNMTVNYFW